MTETPESILARRYPSLLPMIAQHAMSEDVEDDWFDLDAFLIDDERRTHEHRHSD